MADTDVNPDPLAAREAELNVREAAIADREARVSAPAQPTGAAPDYFDQLGEKFFDNPAAALKQLATDVRAATIQEMRPFISTVAQGQVVGSLGDGLGQPGQQYLRQATEQFGITDVSKLDPNVKDMLVRSARSFEAEQYEKNPNLRPAPAPMSAEPAYGLETSKVTAEDRELFGPYIDMVGEEKFLSAKKAEASNPTPEAPGKPIL